jgi:hypothetical protein
MKKKKLKKLIRKRREHVAKVLASIVALTVFAQHIQPAPAEAPGEPKTK